MSASCANTPRRIAWPRSPVRACARSCPGNSTTVVCACESDGTAKTVQGLFHRPEFRIYRSTDVVGVEYGGALKNVIAIAAVSATALVTVIIRRQVSSPRLIRNVPAWRGVRRTTGDIRRLERPRRFDAHVFLQAEPQS